jgi:hypothetical protein
MSDTEQDAALGRALREFLEARQKLAAVRAALNTLASQARDLATALEVKGDESWNPAVIKRVLSQPAHSDLAAEHISALLAEIEHLQQIVNSRMRTLRDAGLAL